MKAVLLVVTLSLIGASLSCDAASKLPRTDSQSQGDSSGMTFALVYGSGSQITAFSNPPSLCARASSTESMLQFTGHGGGEFDRISPWTRVNKGGIGCWQDSSTWSAQPHTWDVKERTSDGLVSAPASYGLTMRIPSDNANPFGSSETCKILVLDTDHPSPQPVSTHISFSFKASCDSGVKHALVVVDKGTQATTIDAESGYAGWETLFDYAGDHTVEAYVIGKNDGFAHLSIGFTLTPN